MSNQAYQVSIESLAAGGDGVSHLPDGRTVFVPGTAPGDRVSVFITEDRKTYARAKVGQLLAAGPGRVAPPCPAFAAGCGGCAWQHLSADAQNEAKASFLREALRRIGGIESPPLDRVRAPGDDGYRYRNKAQVPVALAPAVDQALRFVRDHLGSLGLHPYDQRKGTGTLRHVMVRASTRGEAMVVLVTREALTPDASATAAKWVGQAGIVSVQNNLQAKTGNVVMGETTKVVAGPESIEEDLGGQRFRLSATSFFQVNPSQTRVLLETILGIRTWKPGEAVLELYCGVGTLSLPLAKVGVRLHGVEIHAGAVEDARANAALNGLANASFSVGGAAQGWMGLPAGFAPSVLLVDPPRKGLEPAVFEALGRQPVQALVYVSCDPASLARDAKALGALGYRLERSRGVDLFPQTAHVESVNLFLQGVPGQA
jgi:23S rRNA (uracil1939-C5)-methyltransferase